MRGPSSALTSSASRGRAGIKGVFPTNTSKQTAFSCFRTNSRAALVADVMGGSWGDHRLRDGTFKCQDCCCWHRCQDARRRFGCQPCRGGGGGADLALASALGLILHPGDCLGVYLCGKPRQSLASLHQHLPKASLGQFRLSRPVHIICGI